ncbi:hypothetical protein K7432_015805 [Basidiobolus ranarum]|uniref:Uncharacterized protein n=1 Tax=Basidiobolus ranarum TaxID=34480 RepID=A0ABR2WFS3_9FUNG
MALKGGERAYIAGAGDAEFGNITSESENDGENYQVGKYMESILDPVGLIKRSLN